MATLNRATLMGNLGADPEVRYTPGGKAVCELRLATNESWTDKNGAKQERVEWHRVVVWDKMAENCGKFLRKGRPVYVEGRITTRKFMDKDNKERWTTEIIAANVQFLGAPPTDREEPAQRQRPASSPTTAPVEPSDFPSSSDFGPPRGDDDIPF